MSDFDTLKENGIGITSIGRCDDTFNVGLSAVHIRIEGNSKLYSYLQFNIYVKNLNEVVTKAIETVNSIIQPRRI